MTTEVELKFLANRDISAELAEKLSSYTLLSRSDRQLANRYFDTRINGCVAGDAACAFAARMVSASRPSSVAGRLWPACTSDLSTPRR